jgi:hypothetical protein
MTENDRMISLRFSLNASEFPLPTCKKSETEIELEKLEFSFTKTHPESHFKPDPALDHLLPFPHTTIDLRTFIEPKQKVYLKYFSVEPKEFPVPMGRYLDDQRRIQPAVGVLKIKRIDNQKN